MLRAPGPGCRRVALPDLRDHRLQGREPYLQELIERGEPRLVDGVELAAFAFLGGELGDARRHLDLVVPADRREPFVALAGVQRARFKPYSENGVPTAGWARIPIPFELEK